MSLFLLLMQGDGRSLITPLSFPVWHQAMQAPLTLSNTTTQEGLGRWLSGEEHFVYNPEDLSSNSQHSCDKPAETSRVPVTHCRGRRQEGL